MHFITFPTIQYNGHEYMFWSESDGDLAKLYNLYKN